MGEERGALKQGALHPSPLTPHASPSGTAEGEPPLRLDAPFYTEEELDALYEQDPIQALKISREQTLLRKQIEAAPRIDPNASMPTKEAVQLVLEEARRILLRDGGDLEFVALEGALLRVRLKGNCVGCPRATLDLRNVVEKLVCSRFPQISAVKNIY